MTHGSYHSALCSELTTAFLATAKHFPKLAAISPDYPPFQTQRHATSRFIDNGGMILLAHGVGTGKTFTSLICMETGRAKKMVNRVLVITPTGLRENYASSVKKFTDQEVQVLGNDQEVRLGKAVSIDTAEAKAYNVIGIEMFRQDPLGLVKRLGVDSVVFDESHKSRAEEGATYKALMTIRPYIKNVISMTGTESSNHPEDIIPLLDFVTNGGHELGKKRDFRSRYTRVVGFQKGLHGGKKPVYTLKNTGELKEELAKFVDFVDKTALDPDRFPKTQVEVIPVAMSSYQKMLYDYAMQKAGPLARQIVREGAPVQAKDISHVFASLQYARQVSNSIHVLDTRVSLEQAAEKTPKIKAILDNLQDHLEDTKDGQVIVYSNFIHGGADVIAAGLKARGIPYGIFLGKGNPGSSEEERQAAVQKYRKGEIKVMVVSGAGAEGLDLPDTTLELMADGHYSPARMEQAEARGVRAGGLKRRPPEKRKVVIRRFVSTYKGERTVDQWVYETAERKNRLIQEFHSLLRQTNPKVYAERAKYEAQRPQRIGTVALNQQSLDALLKMPKTEALIDALTQRDVSPTPERPLHLHRQNKYIRRWKDRNGQWRYEYANQAGQQKQADERGGLSTGASYGVAGAGMLTPLLLEQLYQRQVLKKTAPSTVKDLFRQWAASGVRPGDIFVTRDTFKRGPGHSTIISAFDPKTLQGKVFDFGLNGVMQEHDLERFVSDHIGMERNTRIIDPARWRHVGPVIRTNPAPDPARIPGVIERVKATAARAQLKGETAFPYDWSFGLTSKPKAFCVDRGGSTYCTKFTEQLSHAAGGPEVNQRFMSAQNQIGRNKTIHPGSPAFKYRALAVPLAALGAYSLYRGLDQQRPGVALGGAGALGAAGAMLWSPRFREAMAILGASTKDRPYSLIKNPHLSLLARRAVMGIPLLLGGAALLRAASRPSTSTTSHSSYRQELEKVSFGFHLFDPEAREILLRNRLTRLLLEPEAGPHILGDVKKHLTMEGQHKLLASPIQTQEDTKTRPYVSAVHA